MRTSGQARAGILVLVGASILAVTCGPRTPPVPRVEFRIVPPASGGGPKDLQPIAGRVANARSGDVIVLYAKSDVWWVQPFRSRPFTSLDQDLSWNTKTHLGTEYAALLVRPGYRPPITTEHLPALGGDIVAVATVKGAGSYVPPPRRTVAFSGYEWEVRQTPSGRGGQNEYDGRNASTDSHGRLHLLLAQRAGLWTSSEVILTRPLGYGTYVFVVRDAAQLDPAAALGMMTWDDTAPNQNYRELDIEISRWGDPAGRNAQYGLQPQHLAANVTRFESPAGLVTHTMRWEPGRASFASVTGAVVGAGRRIFQHAFTSGVPTSGNERVRLNLVYVRSSPKPPQKDVEVIVDRFVYLP